MAVINIAQGGNKIVQMLGVKELQQNAANIVGAFRGDETVAFMGDAARIVVGTAESNARAANLPSLAMKDFFVYTRQPNATGRRAVISALAGLRKKGRPGGPGPTGFAWGYRQWRANRQTSAGREKINRAKRARDRFSSRVIGTLIGESLASMWEFGTSKMAARPFWRPAVQSSRAPVLAVIAAGYRGIIDRHATTK
jgi:hypothetical protein